MNGFNITGVRDLFGNGPIPVVEPASEDELADVLARANTDGLNLVSFGGATKLRRSLAPERVDLGLSTKHFDQVIAFEAGDGTLTAGGGASISHLVQVCAAGSRSMVPELTPAIDNKGATLGGLIATAETGADRLVRGPIRDHVLGLRVMLANGKSSRSGGRLVKNVAGYDLHRLHTGAWGRLGIILEATLRLFPAWQVQRRVQVKLKDGLLQACVASQAVRAIAVNPKRVFASSAAASDHDFNIDLAGREDVVDHETALLLALFPNAKVQAAEPFEPRPDLILQTQPSRAQTLAKWAENLDSSWSPLITFDPLLARLAVRFTNRSPVEIAGQLPPRPNGVAQVLPKVQAATNPTATFAQQIERALDPGQIFARVN